VDRGDTVALTLANRPEFHIADLAAMSLGATPFSVYLTSTPTNKLARVEQVKRFTIVEGDWLPGGDELTSTMKLKRRPIGEKYAGAIDAMYAG
jgi:long-subunit acyl-CoA synthetase (AMP-forming)